MILKAWITSSILCYSLDFSKPVASINLINLWTRAYIVCLYDCLNDDYPAAAAAEPLQSCPTLCDPIVGSLLGSAIPGILQARTLEWVAISFSNAWKWKAKVKSLSRAWLLATPWTAAYQAPPPMGFSRQECWSGVPLPSPMTILLLAKNKKILWQRSPFFQQFYISSILNLCIVTT